MRCFSNISTLIKNARINHEKKYSQTGLSSLLGYKNGQFISNVERGLCNIPLKTIMDVSQILNINEQDIKDAMLLDYNQTISNYINCSKNEVLVNAESKLMNNNFFSKDTVF